MFAAQYRRFHRHVDDAMLDRCALECGETPIGRMCLLDDDAVARIVERCGINDASRVLDFGCGRGFFGRWLFANGLAARYTGIDRDAGAVDAARRHVPSGTIAQDDFRSVRAQQAYDAVVGIEIAIEGAVDAAVLDCAAGALVAGGTLALTIASVDGLHEGRLIEATGAAEQRFRTVAMEDWTQSVRPFTQRMFEWWRDARWPAELQEKNAQEARVVLDAVAQNRFHYALLFARA